MGMRKLVRNVNSPYWEKFKMSEQAPSYHFFDYPEEGVYFATKGIVGSSNRGEKTTRYYKTPDEMEQDIFKLLTHDKYQVYDASLDRVIPENPTGHPFGATPEEELQIVDRDPETLLPPYWSERKRKLRGAKLKRFRERGGIQYEWPSEDTELYPIKSMRNYSPPYQYIKQNKIYPAPTKQEMINLGIAVNRDPTIQERLRREDVEYNSYERTHPKIPIMSNQSRVIPTPYSAEVAAELEARARQDAEKIAINNRPGSIVSLLRSLDPIA